MSDIVKAEHQPLNWTKEETEIFRRTYLPGASEREAGPLLEMARLRGLNPVLKQIAFVRHKTKTGDVWSPIVTIDGLRSQAEATGLYAGQDEPEYEWDEQRRPISCKVAVYRHDVPRPFIAVCYYEEYAQRSYSGELTKFWKEKPRLMLAKCAEALAIRKAFPVHLSGLYTPEEMPQPEPVESVEVKITAPVVPKRVEAPKEPKPLPSMATAVAWINGLTDLDQLSAAMDRANDLPDGPHRAGIEAAIKRRATELAVDHHREEIDP